MTFQITRSTMIQKVSISQIKLFPLDNNSESDKVNSEELSSKKKGQNGNKVAPEETVDGIKKGIMLRYIRDGHERTNLKYM